MRQSRNLKSTLIEPFKQVKLGLYVMIISVFFMMVVGVLVLNAFYEQYEHVMSIFQVVDPTNKWELIYNPVIETNLFRIGLAIISYIVCLFSTVFWLTHRYYGPLVSIERYLDQLSEGNYSAQVAVRKNDELIELVGKLNTLAETLRERHGSGLPDRRGQRGRRQEDDGG